MAASSSHHGHCLSDVQKEFNVTEEQSTEEIFLESQRTELEIELAALKMIFSSLESSGASLQAVIMLQSSEQDDEEEMGSNTAAPSEYIPNDEDSDFLKAQLESLRLRLQAVTALPPGSAALVDPINLRLR